MNHKDAYTRYRLIDARISNKQRPSPTLQELVAYVSEKMGRSVSVSSIQKDIYAMRYDTALAFNAPIEYDTSTKSYKYTDSNYSINNIPVSEEDLQGLEMAIGLLEQFKDIPAIRLFEDSITKLSSAVKQSRSATAPNQFLILDRPKRYLGIQYMDDIATAIREKREMRLAYQPFSKEQSKKHLVHPYFIKEYNGRMYLIAKDIHAYKESKFLTFAFDRIKDVSILSKTFREEYFDKENYFKHAIGITLSDSMVETIVLKFDPAQANYLKSQPLHHTQQIVKDTSHEFSISLKLVVNYELVSLIQSFGDKVKVMKPEFLAERLKESAQKIVAQYTSKGS